MIAVQVLSTCTVVVTELCFSVISETSVGEDSDEYLGEVQEGYNLRQTTRRRTASADDAMQQRLGASVAASPLRKRRRLPTDVNPVLQPIGN